MMPPLGGPLPSGLPMQPNTAPQHSVQPQEVLQISSKCIEDALLRDETTPLTVEDVFAPGMQRYEKHEGTYDSRGFAAPPTSWGSRSSGSASFSLSGYFSEIECAWQSVGPVLHLWTSDNRSKEYIGVDQDILAAAVVRAKSFLEADFVLVLTTVSEVSLHSLRFRPDAGIQLQKLPTYTLATDDTRIIRIEGDPRSRRIFMGGQDGGIYEFRYTREDDRGFFRKRAACAKHTLRSAGYLPAFLSSLFGSSNNNPEKAVEQLTVDSTRELLYALRRDVILVFDIASNVGANKSGSNCTAGSTSSGSEPSPEEDMNPRCHFLFEFFIKDIMVNLRRLNIPSMLSTAKPIPGIRFPDPKKVFDPNGIKKGLEEEEKSAAGMSAINTMSMQGGGSLLASTAIPMSTNSTVGGLQSQVSTGGVIPGSSGAGAPTSTVNNGGNTNEQIKPPAGTVDSKTRVQDAVTAMKVNNSIVKIFPMIRTAGWETQVPPHGQNSVRQQIAGISMAQRTSMQYEATDCVLQAVCRDGTRIFFNGSFVVKLAFGQRSAPSDRNGQSRAAQQRLQVAHGAGMPTADAALHHLVEEARRGHSISTALRNIKIGHAQAPPVDVFPWEDGGKDNMPYLVNDAYSLSGVTLLCVRPTVKRNLAQVQLLMRAHVSSKARDKSEYVDELQQQNPGAGLDGDAPMVAKRDGRRGIFDDNLDLASLEADQHLIDEDDELCSNRLLCISTDMRSISQRVASRTPWTLRGLPSERYDILPLHPNGFAAEIFSIGELALGSKLTDPVYTGSTDQQSQGAQFMSFGGAKSSAFAGADKNGVGKEPSKFFQIGEVTESSIVPAMGAPEQSQLVPAVPMQPPVAYPFSSAMGGMVDQGADFFNKQQSFATNASSGANMQSGGNSSGLRLRPTWKKQEETPFLQYSQLSELCTQQALESRQFYLLTSEGILFLQRLRPAEELMRDLVIANSSNNIEQSFEQSAAQFFESYTAEEGMAVCFQIASGAANLNTAACLRRGGGLFGGPSGKNRGFGGGLGGAPRPLTDLGMYAGQHATTLATPGTVKALEHVGRPPESFASVRNRALANAGIEDLNYSSMTSGMRGFSSALPSAFRKKQQQLGAASSPGLAPMITDTSGMATPTNRQLALVQQPAQVDAYMRTGVTPGTTARQRRKSDMMMQLAIAEPVPEDPFFSSHQLAVQNQIQQAINDEIDDVWSSAGWHPDLTSAASAAERMLFTTEAALRVGGLVVYDANFRVANNLPGGQQLPGPGVPNNPQQLNIPGGGRQQTAQQQNANMNQPQVLAQPQSQNFLSGYGYVVSRGAEQRLAETCRVRGLILYISRLVRPFWLVKVLQVMQVKQPNSYVPTQGGVKRGRDDSFLSGQNQNVNRFSSYCVTWRRSEREWLDATLRGVRRVLQKARRTNVEYFGDERVLFEGMSTIVERSIGVLQFLHLLAQRLLVENGRHDLSGLAQLPFRDLVQGDNGRAAVQQLVKEAPKFFDCTLIAKKCPHLISMAEAEIQHAYEMLETPNIDVGPAIALLEKNIAIVDMRETGSRLRARGCIRTLVEFAARKAKQLDPNDEVISNPNSHVALHTTRLSLYNPLYSAFEDLLIRAEGRVPMRRGAHTGFHGVNEVPLIIPGNLNAIEASSIVDKLIQYVLHTPDQLLQCGLFKLLRKWNLPIWELESPYLEPFLVGQRPTQPEMLCKYLQANNRFLDACEEYRAIARLPWPADVANDAGPVYSLDDRIGFLRIASMISQDQNLQDVQANIQFLIRQLNCQSTAKLELEDQQRKGATTAASLQPVIRDVQASVLDIPVLRAIADKYRLFVTHIGICYWHGDTRHLRHYVDIALRENLQVNGFPDEAKDFVTRLSGAYLRARDNQMPGTMGMDFRVNQFANQHAITQQVEARAQNSLFLPVDLIALRLFEYTQARQSSVVFCIEVLRECLLSWPEMYLAFASAPIPKCTALYELKHMMLLQWQEQLSLTAQQGRNVGAEIMELRKCYQALTQELQHLGPAQVGEQVIRNLNHLSARIETLPVNMNPMMQF
ncbi:unnamed protein product [Amoebophrya sp. A120]|nr:unnamed protein product [Amoebophrya sp. A120]|eukprot:GSA120T00005501001.1